MPTNRAEHFVSKPGDIDVYETEEEARTARREAEQAVQQALAAPRTEPPTLPMPEAPSEKRVEPPGLSAPYYAPTEYAPKASTQKACRGRAARSALRRRGLRRRRGL